MKTEEGDRFLGSPNINVGDTIAVECSEDPMGDGYYFIIQMLHISRGK